MKLKLIPLLVLPALMLLLACGGTTEPTFNMESIAALPTPNPGSVAVVPWNANQQGDIEGQLTLGVSGYTCESIIDEYIEVTKDNAPWVNEILLSDPPLVVGRSDERLTCLGDVTLNTGDTLSVQFSTYIDSDGVRWVGGRVAPFANVSMRYTDGKGNYRTE